MHPRLIIAALGALTAVLGLCMAICLPWSIYYQDQSHWQLLGLVACCVGIGGALYMSFRDPVAEYSLRDGFAIVTFAWLIAGVLGALPFWLTGTLPDFVDAFFESVSGFTTTGATVIKDIEKVGHGVLFWRSLTHWLGGMGIIVLSVAILPLLGVGGMAMFKAEIPSPIMDKLKPTIAATAKTLWKVYLILTVAETILLLLGGMNLFDSLCHTFGTLATGGFSTKNNSLAYYDSTYIHLVVTIFMLLAGLNFSLHYQALGGVVRGYWNSLECRVYLILFVLATGFVAWNVWGDQYLSLPEALRYAAFTTSSIMTTTGFVTANWEKWPWACQWLLLMLMFMGGCAGSTGGGIKCMRLLVVGKHVLRELRLLTHPRAVIPIKIDRKVLQTPVVNSILAFVGLFVGIWSISTFLLVILDIDLTTAIGATTATLSNVGPGLHKVGAVHDYAWISPLGKAILIFDMLAGRLELYTVLVLMTPNFWRR